MLIINDASEYEQVMDLIQTNGASLRQILHNGHIATELLFKAFLTKHDVHYPKTHDLKELCQIDTKIKHFEVPESIYKMLDKAYLQIAFEYDIAFVALSPNEANGSVQGFEDADYMSKKDSKSQKIASKEL